MNAIIVIINNRLKFIHKQRAKSLINNTNCYKFIATHYENTGGKKASNCLRKHKFDY